MEFRVDLTQVTFALSDALDLVGGDITQHGKRVAYIATECVGALGWPRRAMGELFLASVLHDCGVSSTELHRHLLERFELEDPSAHCERGYTLLSEFEPFTGVADIVRRHHTLWEERAPADDSEQAALSGNAIFLADRVDVFLRGRPMEEILLTREEIAGTVEAHSGTHFAPPLTQAFLEISRREAFWLTLEPHHLERYLSGAARSCCSTEISLDQLAHLADIFSRVVDFKSAFTLSHSRGVARLAKLLGELAGLPQEQCRLLEISGLLHDIGKLRVPDRILAKPDRLDHREMAAMRRHPFEGYHILSKIQGLEEVAEWASFHHETPAGDGYPFRLPAERLSLPARIVAVADVVQALAQTRPYRRPLVSEPVLRIIRSMAESKKLDAGLVDLVADNLEACMAAATAPRSPAAELGIETKSPTP
jgi:HD-GYP domain-containing protein (c-di-GMP phosphodiesterase class II)